MLEVAQPTVIRRTVAFAETVYQEKCSVEGITACLATEAAAVAAILTQGNIAVMVDPQWESIAALRPVAVVDAIIAKRNLGTTLTEAPVVIGLGPGFTAGTDVHAVIETMRGHDLGRVIYQGSAIPDTGVPGEIAGYASERLLRATAKGVFRAKRQIADAVLAGDVVAEIGGVPLVAEISGILRGILRDGLNVVPGFKVGDIDPRCERQHCFTVSDKARAIGGGVVEALLHLTHGVTECK